MKFNIKWDLYGDECNKNDIIDDNRLHVVHKVWITKAEDEFNDINKHSFSE